MLKSHAMSHIWTVYEFFFSFTSNWATFFLSYFWRIAFHFMPCPNSCRYLLWYDLVLADNNDIIREMNCCQLTVKIFNKHYIWLSKFEEKEQNIMNDTVIIILDDDIICQFDGDVSLLQHFNALSLILFCNFPYS